MPRLLSILRQLPALAGWRFLVAIAHKQKLAGVTICDISKRDDLAMRRATQDVLTALSLFREQKPKLFRRVQAHVSCVSLADIPDPFHYYSVSRLFLLRHEAKSHPANTDALNELVATLADAGTFAYLASKNVNMAKWTGRIAALLSMQREFQIGGKA